jgi:hypothetical protein
VIASVEVVIASVEVVIASVEVVIASVEVVIASVEVVTGSVEVVTGSLEVVTGSLEVVTGSLEVVTGSLEVVTGSLEVVTGSLEVVIISLAVVTSTGGDVVGVPTCTSKTTEFGSISKLWQQAPLLTDTTMIFCTCWPITSGIVLPALGGGSEGMIFDVNKMMNKTLMLPGLKPVTSVPS